MDENTEKEFSSGFVPFLQADGDITIHEAGAIAAVVGGNANIKEGGAGLCVVGGDVSITQGGTGNLLVGGSAELNQASVGQMAALEATVTDSRVGVLLAARADLERSEVLVTAREAAIFGGVAGIVLFLLTRLFRRK